MAISLDDIKRLRELSGAGMMDIQAALKTSGGDFDKAMAQLRAAGQATNLKRAAKATQAGLVEAYTHMGRVGALVEVNCETDFVARTDDFKAFVHELAMQVAATNPAYLEPADVSRAAIAKETAIYKADPSLKGKTSAIAQKIIEGKLAKFYQDVCLLKQPTLKRPELSVEEAIAELVAKLGEKIVIRRFSRYELGVG